MSDVFAALRSSGIHPMTEVLKRELARRVPLWTRTGYAYQGSADLLQKHGTFFVGRELPDRYLDVLGPSGECFSNAHRAVEAHPELRYFQGVYCAASTVTPHGWCVAPDGGVVEVTYPTREDYRERHTDRNGLPIVHPSRIAYCGIEIQPALVMDHADRYDDTCLLDRPAADAEFVTLDTDQPHDFPFLKLPYDPNRTAFPPDATPPIHP